MPVQVNVAANQQALVNSIQQGVNAFNRRFASKNSLDLKINPRSFTQPLGRITGAVDDFGSAMAASNARVIAFGASTAVLGTAVASFRSLAKATIDVEKNLTDVNRILQLNTNTLQEFSRALFDISKRTATSFNEASKALLEFSRQGLDAEETLKRTSDALTLTRLAGLGAEASVAALTATVNGFSKSGITTTQVLNKLVAVEQAFAVSARDLSEGLARTGQAAQEAGVDIDQLNALISAAQQKTARGGAVIGNALKTIFTRLQRTDTLDQLERFDIAVRNVEGNILPATQILQNFANAYYGIADAQRAQLAEQVAGVYQVNVLKALLSDLNSEQSIYSSALKVGTSATNEASIANAKLNQTLSALLTQLGNNTQQLASTIGSVTFDPLARSAVKAVNSIMEYITSTITGDGIGSDIANGLLKGIRNVLSGPGAVAAFYTLFKVIQNSFTYVAQALPQLAGITTETQKRQNLEQAILSILQSENNISKSILGNTGNQAQQAKILLGVAQQQTNQYREQLRLAGSLAGVLRSQGVSVGARGLQTGKTRSGGYIPPSTKRAEKAGALAGGYTPGAVVNSPVGGVMNTAEDVKYVPGFAQPFINPPKNSRAGKLHRANAVRQVGIDPYQYRGFVPNFASLSKGYMDLGDLDAFSRSRTELLKYAGIKQKGNKLSKSNINLEDQIKFGFDKVVKFDATKVPGFQRVTNVRDSGLSKKAFGDAFEAAIIKSGRFGNIELAHGLKGDFGSAVDMVNKGAKITKVIEAKGGGYDPTITPFKTARAIAENLGDSRFRKMFTSPNQETLKNSTLLIENANYPKAKSKFPRRKKYDGYIPSFGVGYRNPFTGQLNNAAIARGLRSGKLTQQQAQAMGYSTSGSKIDARKNKRAAAVNALNYTMAYVPWDIERFRGGRSGGRLNIAQGTAYEKFILNLLRSGKLKGTTSLGAPFALPARPDVVSSAGLKGGTSARIDGYSLSAGEMYEMKAGDPGATLAGLQNKFVKAIENNPEILNPKRKWKNYIFRTTAAKGRGASGGFIPNLAYKGEVMDLEEFISGQKAIYSESPFPHVRNESQPTFASAIADHGGLGNALKDSYRNQSAAGLANGGYVPNFAAKYQTMEGAGVDIITGTKKAINLTTDSQKKLNLELKNLIRLYKEGALTRKELIASTDKLADENKLTLESQKRLRKNINARARSEDKKQKADKKSSSKKSKLDSGSLGLAIAFAGPMVAGAVEQALYGNMSRLDMTRGQRFGQSALSGGLTYASTGASVGAAFGPAGAAIGGLAGAAIGLTKAFFDMELSTEELIESFQKASQEQVESAANYKTALVGFQKALDEGDVKGQEKAREDLANVLAGITDPKFLSQLSGTTSARDIDEIIQKSRKDASRAVGLQSLNIKGVTSGRGDQPLAENLFQSLTEGALNFAEAIGDGLKAALEGAGSIISNLLDLLQTSYQKVTNAFQDSTSTLLSFLSAKTQLVFDDVAGGLNKFLPDNLKIERINNRGGLSFAAELAAQKLNTSFQQGADALKGTFDDFLTKNENVINNSMNFLRGYTNVGAMTGIARGFGGRDIRELSDTEVVTRGSAILKDSSSKEGINSLLNLVGSSTFKAAESGFTEGLQPISGDAIDVAALIKEIAAESNARDRDELIKTLTQYLGSIGISGSEIESAERLIRDLSSGGNNLGQEFLANLDKFAKFFAEGNEGGKEAADKILADVENFTRLRENLQKEISDFVNANTSNEIILAEGIKRQRLAIDELLSNTVGFGRPFEAIDLRRRREEFNINQDVAGRERSQIQDLRRLTVGDLNTAVQNQSRQRYNDLVTGFEEANLSAQQRIDQLRIFLQDEKNVDAEKRQTLLLQLDVAERTLKNSLLEGEEKRKTADYVLEQEKRRAEQQRSISFQFQKSVSGMNDQGTLMLSQLAYDAPRRFADGMANALSEVAQGTKSIGDAFTDMAIDFGRMLQQEVFRALAAKAVGNLLGNFAIPTPSATGQTGGLMSKGVIKAQNGMYISGGRTGDRNLALLEDGEYVLNRNAVKMMGGSKSLDKMNFDMAPRFASGGYFSMAPEMARKNGELSATGNLMYNSTNVGLLSEDMYTSFALENSPYFQNQRKKAQERFQRNVQKRFEKRQKRAQMVGAIVGAIGGAMMAYGAAGMAAASSQATSAASTPLKASIDGGSLVAKEGASKAGKLLQGVKDGTVNMNQFTKFAARNPQDFLLNGAQLAAKPNLFSGVATRMTSLQTSLSEAGYKSTISASRAASSSARSGALQSLFGSASNMAKTGKNQKGGLIGYNAGGYVPYGSRLNDTIPAMLTGGEYVMNNKAVKKYGVPAMNQMNAGSYQVGGATNSATTNNTNNNSTSISINVDRSGKAVYGAQTNSYEKNDIVISKEMAKQINGIVLKTMVNEKRYGGELYKNPLRT